MKHILFVPALAPMLLAMPALAAEVPATLKLDQVTVNPAGAQVQRVGEVTVPAGTHEIIIDNLPAGIPASSIQVEGKAAPGAEIGTVDVSLIQLDPAQQMQGERKRLQDELDALSRDRARQERTRADADFRRATLERLTASSGSSDKAAMTPEQLMAVLSLTSKELADISQTVLDAEAAIARIDERIGVVERKIAELAATPEARTRVAVQVAADAETKMTLSLSYSVPEAGWRPVYDARLKLPQDGAKSGSLELVSRALVYQQTGESWDDVALKLSTATVTGRTAAPELEPVAAGPRPPVVAYNTGDAGTMAADEAEGKQVRRAMKQEMPGAAPAPEPVRQREAEVLNAGFHAVYTIAGRSSIPNTGSAKSVRIGSTLATPDLRVDTAPMLDPQGYLTAVFKVAGETPMLPGEVSLFRDGVFVGKSRIGQSAPGEQVELGFGRDDLVKVVRRQLDDTAGSSGIITEQNTLTRRYVTAIENLHSFPVTVRMSERMPYSTHEDVVVEMLRETTAPTTTDPDNRRGIVQWDVPLQPAAKTEVTFGYKLTYPTQMSVVLPD